MYAVKPICEKVVLQNMPNTMYKVKCYVSVHHADANQTDTTVSDVIVAEELSKQLNNQLRRLERLCLKTNDLCDELSLNNLVISDVKMKTSTPALSASSSSKSVNQPQLATLSRDQADLFKRIHNLSNRANQLCEDLKLNDLVVDLKGSSPVSKSADKSSNTQHSSSAPILPRKKLQVDLKVFSDIKRITEKQIKDRPIEDIVINLDPKSKNANEVFNFVDQMTQKFKCFVHFHRHNTVQGELSANEALSNRLHNFDDLFEALKLNANEPRSRYDYGFTFIWKKSESTEPNLTFSSLDKPKIVGEQKILQFINETLPADKRIDLKTLKAESPLIKVIKSL